MNIDWPGLSEFILALVGGAGVVSAYYLNKRGARQQERQQHAANILASRVQAFDELESLNDRLRNEVDLLSTSHDRRVQRQAARCRQQVDSMTSVIATLQSVVIAEVAKAAASDVLAEAVDHLHFDHIDHIDHKDAS